MLLVALTACATTGPAQRPSSRSPSPGASVEQRASSPTDVTARGVLLAAVLVVEGDVQSAIADGLITVAELDEALLAIERDELDAWAKRAEAELDD